MFGRGTVVYSASVVWYLRIHSHSYAASYYKSARLYSELDNGMHVLKVSTYQNGHDITTRRASTA